MNSTQKEPIKKQLTASSIKASLSANKSRVRGIQKCCLFSSRFLPAVAAVVRVGVIMRSILTRSSSSREHKNEGSSGSGTKTHLYLNVYDLTPINNYLYWLGLGIFHSGIEVHGMEYGFGAHEYSLSGVFEVEPKICPGFIYRRLVWLGTTDMSRSEFRLFLEDISGKYHGDTYHLIAKNCNHFTDDICKLLTGKPIPGWVNRLARLGSFCNCLLPESIQVTTVRHLPDHAYSEGSDSFVSLVMEETDDEQLNHQLLTTPPDSSPAHSRDKSLKLARDIL